ncbi:MAG: hypothetical protein AAF665_16780 [Pseudomonadota bacterium]
MDAIQVGGLIMTYVGGIWASFQILQALFGKFSLRSFFERIGIITLLALWLILMISIFSLLINWLDGAHATVKALGFIAVSLCICTIVHVSSMAVIGSSLGAEIEKLKIGLGPELFGWEFSSGTKIEVAIPILSGHVKFRELEGLTSAIIGLIAPLTLLTVSSLLVGINETLAVLIGTFGAFVEGLISMSFKEPVSQIVPTVSALPYSTTLAYTFSTVAAICLVPIPGMNGGQIVLGSADHFLGIKPSDQTIQRIYLGGVLVILYAWGLFIIAVLFGW